MTVLSTSIRNIYKNHHYPELITEEETRKISEYIGRLRSDLRSQNAYRRPESTGLARAIQFTSENRVFVHLNKSCDPLLGETRAKKIKIAIDADTGQLFASSASTYRRSGQENPLDREVEVLQKIRGLEGWIEFFGNVVYESKTQQRKQRIVLEYCNGGDLFEAIEKDRGLCVHKEGRSRIQEINITREEKRLIFEKLIRALAGFHAMGYIHGDIKPENVLLIRNDEGKIVDIRIIDVGGSRHMDDDIEKVMTISLAYCSPEYFSFYAACKQAVSPSVKLIPPAVTSAHDMWSLGGLLFNLFHINVTELPFCNLYARKEQVTEQHRNIKHYVSEFQFPSLKGGVTAQHVASRLIRKNPSSRLTAQEINENWLSRINWASDD